MTTFAATTTNAAAPRRTRSRAATSGCGRCRFCSPPCTRFRRSAASAEAQNVAGFQAMGLGNTGMYIIGSLELAGAIAMFVPRLTGLAATCFVALMIGAVTMTLAIGGGVLAVIPAVVLVLAAVVAWVGGTARAAWSATSPAAEPSNFPNAQVADLGVRLCRNGDRRGVRATRRRRRSGRASLPPPRQPDADQADHPTHDGQLRRHLTEEGRAEADGDRRDGVGADAEPPCVHAGEGVGPRAERQRGRHRPQVDEPACDRDGRRDDIVHQARGERQAHHGADRAGQERDLQRGSLRTAGFCASTPMAYVTAATRQSTAPHTSDVPRAVAAPTSTAPANADEGPR